MNDTELATVQHSFLFWEWVADKAFLLVVIALALEFMASRWAKPHRDALDQTRELRIAQLTRDAARLSVEADTARAAIAQADARAKEAERGAAQAHEQAARAHLELAKLRSPRWLSDKQEHGFVSALERFSGVPLFVMAPGVDPEAIGFAIQISSLCEKAGWQAQIVSAADPDIAGVSGMLIEIGEGADAASESAAATLRKALHSAGMEVSGPRQRALADPSAPIRLIIGRKPI